VSYGFCITDELEIVVWIVHKHSNNFASKQKIRILPVIFTSSYKKQHVNETLICDHVLEFYLVISEHCYHVRLTS